MPIRRACVAAGIGRSEGRRIARSKRRRPRAARRRSARARSALPRPSRASAVVTWRATVSSRLRSRSRRLPRSLAPSTIAASVARRQAIDAGVGSATHAGSVEEVVVVVVEAVVVVVLVLVLVVDVVEVLVVAALPGVAATSTESALAPPASTPPVYEADTT